MTPTADVGARARTPDYGQLAKAAVSWTGCAAFPTGLL